MQNGTGARRQLDWLSDQGDVGGLMREIVAASDPDADPESAVGEPLPRIIRYDFSSELPCFCGVKYGFRINGHG